MVTGFREGSEAGPRGVAVGVRIRKVRGRTARGVEGLFRGTRELEVLRLLAQSLSNNELAARLHLSETTVKTHVSRILAKLQLRDRVQVVVVAYETRLVRAADRRGP